MNTKFLSALTATAAATALFGAAAPAHAFSFGTNTIQFENDTQVIFNFRQSYGMFQSSLGIYGVSGGTPTFLKTLFSEVKSSDSGANNNWKGTLGNTVLGSGIATYTFLANQVYTLGLNSGSNGTVYSTSALNSGGTQQALFFNPNGMLPTIINAADGAAFAGNPADFSSGSSLFNGGVAISFDDRGNGNDADFQDFTVTATAEPVPEPMTMTGLALGLGGLVAARRRRGSKTA
ncbi:PEP-CTERM sorting domain-containing protein [Microcoleus sp. AR_TQ3_B6]|uniref:PEP-CTERM sorting domain-containing protein n=1 Tax=Microcoleus sp. AR_TQ3_B6 TaxID=3055284 RepID=UPI002FD456FF